MHQNKYCIEYTYDRGSLGRHNWCWSILLMFSQEVPLLKKTIGTFGQIKEASGFSIGGTWGRRRSRGGRNKNWRIQTLFFPLVKLCCASKWKWGPFGHHSHFLRCFLFVILQCSSLSWNTTDEGAIALKALVHVQNKCQIQLCSVWWISEENSRVALKSITENYRVVQSITEYYRVIQSMTEYYRV